MIAQLTRWAIAMRRSKAGSWSISIWPTRLICP